jgi:hypothetical protein
MGHEAAVGVIAPKEQPVLGAGSEHAVGLAMLEADEIVDHDPDVRLVATEDQRRPLLEAERGVDPRDDSLAARLLVAARPIDLSGEMEAAHPLGLQRRVKLVRGRVVVLDRVSESKELRLFQAGHGVNELLLHIRRGRR